MDGGEEIGPTLSMPEGGASREQLLREQAATIARYKKMYDRASSLAKIGVWECDLATETLTWTDGVYDLFELPRGIPIGRDQIVALYAEDSRQEMERVRAEAIRDGTSFVLDIKINTAKGRERWLRLSADVEKENGRPVRIFGTKQDITEEKAAREKVLSLQAELIHVSRRSAMDTMAATLAHELNQPLTAINNYVAGARRLCGNPGHDGKELGESLEAIEKCAFGAGRIIRSLREMTSDTVRRRSPTDPNPLIREAAALVMMSTTEKAAIHFQLGNGLKIDVDPIQIQQVFINLIKNAFEAVENSPRREISIVSSAGRAKVAVRIDDSGRGIPAGLEQSMFDSFVTSKLDGMGVGLSISRTIVEAHGGSIHAENRPEGGASFLVTLPRAR